MERVGEIELFNLDKKVLTHVSYCQVSPSNCSKTYSLPSD